MAAATMRIVLLLAILGPALSLSHLSAGPTRISTHSHQQQHYLNWTVSRFNHSERPDGLKQRGAISVNGAAGSLTPIEVNEGDQVYVNVTNHLEVPTTIHFHGMQQLANCHNDGASMVTQCPIIPRSSFVYRFNATPAGTHWWHAHHRGHYADGLRGPLIVHPRNAIDNHGSDTGSISTDPTKLIFIEDRDYRNSEQIIDEYLTPGALVPLPSSGLINNRGLPNGGFGLELDDPHSEVTQLTLDRLKPSDFSCVEATISSADLNAAPITRLRVINAASVMLFVVQIDGHKIRAVGVDGTSTHPSEWNDAIEVDIGQRVELDVIPIWALDKSGLESTEADAGRGTEEEQRPQSYWIRATMPKSAHNMTALTIRGLLTYDACRSATLPRPATIPPSPVRQVLGSNAIELEPIDVIAAPPHPDTRHILAWDFHVDSSGRDRSNVTRGWTSVNVTRPLTDADGETWIPPVRGDRVVLHNLLQHSLHHSSAAAAAAAATADRRSGGNILEHTESASTKHLLPIWVEEGQVIDLLMLNREMPPHPFHLHGHTVWVLGSGVASSVDQIPSFDSSSSSSSSSFASSLANPIRRDTWTVPSGSWGGATFGWTLVRFRADNPGAWMLHCHLEYHVEAGLAMTVLYKGVASFPAGGNGTADDGEATQASRACESYEDWRQQQQQHIEATSVFGTGAQVEPTGWTHSFASIMTSRLRLSIPISFCAFAAFSVLFAGFSVWSLLRQRRRAAYQRVKSEALP